MNSPSLRKSILRWSTLLAIMVPCGISLLVALILFFGYRSDRLELHYKLVRSAAQTIELFMRQPMQIVSELGYQLEVYDEPGPLVEKAGRGLSERNDYLDYLVLLDSRKMVLATGPSGSLMPGNDLSELRLLSEPMSIGEIRIGLDPRMDGNASGRPDSPRLLIASRVKNGFLLGFFKVDELNRFLQGMVDPDFSDIGLIDENGSYVMHSNSPVADLQPGDYSLAEAGGTVYKAGQHRIRRNGRTEIMSIHPLLDGKWAVVAYENFAPMVLRLRQAILWGCVAILVMLLPVMLLVFWSTTKVVKPLEMINERLKAIADGDYTQQVEYQGFSEFEGLTNRFNDMASHVRNFRDELTREIEDRCHAEKVLRELLDDKDVLLQELHHRVKNNLQIMSSLLNLQIMRVQNKTAKSLVQGARLKLLALAMVHEQVYLSASVSQIDLAEFVRDLASLLQQELRRDGLVISFEFSLEPVFLQVDKATTASILLNELMTNAVLHAFPESGKGKIRTTVSQETQGVLIVLQDDGVGLPKDVQPADPQSLGFTLVQSLITQLQGTVSFTDANPGLRVQLQFPL